MIKWYKPSEKYKEYLQKSGEMYSTHGENSYYAGYELAQKEMQEKLDAAIEVIKFYANEKSWFSLIGSISNNSSKIAISEDSENIRNEATWSTYSLGGKRARDFLKARGE